MYEGEWLDDKAHCKGKFVYLDGSYYEGDFREDKYEGDGVE